MTRTLQSPLWAHKDEDIIEHDDANVAQEQEHEVGNDGAEFSRGPFDTSLFTHYVDLVARVIWEGQISQRFV